MRLVSIAIVSALILGSSAMAADANWFANSPGTLKEVKTSEKAPDDSPARRITFAPVKGGPEYWCGTGLAFDPPREDNAVSFYARSSRPRALEFKVIDSKDRAGYYRPGVTEQWSQINIRRESPAWTEPNGTLQDIARIEFIFNSNQFAGEEPYQLWISKIGLKTVAPKKYLHPNWMPAKTPPPVPGYRIGTMLHNAWVPGKGEYTGLDKPGGLEMAKDLIDHLVEQYGTIEMTIAEFYARGEEGREFFRYLAEKGGVPMAESHHGGIDAAPAINIHGQDARQAGWSAAQFHGQDHTSPKLLAQMQEKQLVQAKLGAVAWRNVDYIWPYWGGPVWGYSETAIQAWRNALSEADGGFPIVDGPDGKTRIANFWEYFESYMGYRMTPQDAGFESWSQYLPPQANAKPSPQLENNQTLHNLLYHYWWVKFCSDVTIPSAEYGSLSQPITNPEHFANGTEYAWLFKAALVRGASIEWWAGAEVILPNYYNGRYYDNIARKHGRELVNHGETAAAGGSPYQGKPHYWDNQANYLITYAQSGSVDFKAKHDQYWSSSWASATNPEHPEYQNYTGFHSAWCGFLQCRNDKAFKPKADVLALTHRPIARDEDSFDRGSGAQRYNLARDLFELNYLHDGAAFPIEDAFDVGDYKTVFHCAYMPPKAYVEKLAAWVSASSERTLVTHSFIPTRFAAPAPAYDFSDQRLIQPGGMEKALRFDSISQSELSSGVLKAHDPAFAQALGELNGKRAQFSAGIFQVSGDGKVLVSLGNHPLISERQMGQGRILYLHYIPQETGIAGRQLQRALSDGIMRYLGYAPQGISQSHRVLAFDRPGGGKTFVTIYTDPMTEMLGPNGTDIYNVFQAQDPEVKGKAQLRVAAPNAEYRITDMITGEQETRQSDEAGYLTIDLDGWNMRGLYVDPV